MNSLRVWLYYRLSRDEDKELNSLTNQKKILVAYAEEHGYQIVGESFDDNVSGMHFNREGIEKIQDGVDKGRIDAVIVKDLSRLGRHKTQTAMFIDYLREKNVKVLSVTENIDTSNEDDELMVGFKGIFNDMYCRDISKKIRAGYKQKQKEGLVLIPPMGYFKDKNTKEVKIIEEQAAIIREIFNLYLSGYGTRTIANMLNDRGIKSQGYYQKKLLGKDIGYNKPEISRRFLWSNENVLRVLKNEFYAGTLICHKSYTNKINRIRRSLSEEEHFRHENFVPAIISKETFETVQTLIESKRRSHVRASKNKPYHRYSGLLFCAECGSAFTCQIRKWKETVRFEYVCHGYRRFGKKHCASHRIKEETLDELILDELKRLKVEAAEKIQSVEADIKRWSEQKGTHENVCTELNARLERRKTDQKELLLERIRDRERADIYTEMLLQCEEEINSLSSQLQELTDIDATVKKRRTELKSAIKLLDAILADNAIDNTHLRLLIDKILVHKEEDKTLSLEFHMKADFEHRTNTYAT